MFDVIIVEDKKITREGLMRLVDWESIGGYAAAAFSGANAAIDYIAHRHVDLVVTDIAMSDGTGLDLLRYVCENRPEIKVIVMSAYEKFSYAHQALSMGACAYLLKPVDSAELLLTARRAFDEIEKREHVKTQASFLQWSKLADEIARCLSGACLDQLQAPLDDLKESFSTEKATFLYFRTYGAKSVSCRQLREIANETGQPVFIFPSGQNFCCVLSGALQASDEVLQILLGQWKLRPPFRIGISEPAAEGLSSWRECFLQAQSAFATDFWSDHLPGIYRFSLASPVEIASTTGYLDYAELKKCLWADNIEAALQHLDDTLEFCRAQNCEIQTTETNFEETLSRLYAAGGVSASAPAKIQQELTGCDSLSSLKQMMRTHLETCFKLVSEQKAQVVRPIVKLALEYSIRHIDQPELNLKTVAQKLGVSYVYLSKAFKEDFQKGYSEYIALYRIELAKEYLLDPCALVYEVCAKVGLEPKNFHGLFKKHTGMTPKTYQARNVHYEELPSTLFSEV